MKIAGEFEFFEENGASFFKETIVSTLDNDGGREEIVCTYGPYASRIEALAAAHPRMAISLGLQFHHEVNRVRGRTAERVELMRVLSGNA